MARHNDDPRDPTPEPEGGPVFHLPLRTARPLACCHQCGGTNFYQVRFRPARGEWRLFGRVIRTAKPDRIEAACDYCDAVTEFAPGTVELP